MHTESGSAPTELPPIVLFVEDDRDTLDMYATYFEMSGIWVARSATPAEALTGVDDLWPDVVITDLGFRAGSGSELVHALKSRAETHDIPVIVLSGRSPEEIPSHTRDEADLCLVKPVLPDVLLANVRRLFERSVDLRERSARVRRRTAGLVAKSHGLIQKARGLGGTRPMGRPCPECGAPLEWIERGRVGEVDYDYYRWCPRGCGLFCFDPGGGTWVKLA